MKRTKKSRVSWPSENKLCQVKMFLKEDCPAKVGPSSPMASNLPPGFEATDYATRLHIPRTQWKRPPKFILNDAWLVASGEESTEIRSENLRISKVLEAFYPHRSVIPTRPWVSLAVEEEHYDDLKTPLIPLTSIDDEPEPLPAVESSHNSISPAAFSGLGPDSCLAASAVLSALMKTNEQGSRVDADLLVKLLSDPEIVKSLLNGTTGQPLQTANYTLNPNVAEPRLAPPQHVTSSAMDINPPLKPRTQPGNAVPHIVPLSVQTSATHPPFPKPIQPVSSALSMDLNHQNPPPVCHTYPLSSGPKPLPRIEDSYAAPPLKPSPVVDVVVSEQKTQSLNVFPLSTWNMNRVPDSARTETQTRNGNINRDDQACAKPVKNLDYYKSLIREHGVVPQATKETNKYKGKVEENKVVKAKFQIACKYFGRGRGCKMGERCLYLHDSSKRVSTDLPSNFPRAKRPKYLPISNPK
ncbi:Zinc finger CCCH domain-containing protein 68 [Cardamine amara subsp. amara]|uniref:Zinc finger CCCH domain-containing protein 68 n=1 Tax=Cardamine amara subsp. amara TaxID=228776 RepID=A0ABD1BJA0_CARAN